MTRQTLDLSFVFQVQCAIVSAELGAAEPQARHNAAVSHEQASQVRIARWKARKRKFAGCSMLCPRKSLLKTSITTSTCRRRSGEDSKPRNAAISLIKKRSRGAWQVAWRV